MQKTWISFRFLPASIGLKGDAYEEAEAHYTLTGEALDRKILSIRYKLEPDVLKRKLLAIDLKHGKLNQYEYETKVNSLVDDEDARFLKQLDVDLLHKKITSYDADVKRIEYMYDDDDSEKELMFICNDVKHGKLNEYQGEVAKLKVLHEEGTNDFKLGMIDIRLNFNKMTEYDAEIARVKIKTAYNKNDELKSDVQKLALLEVNHKFHKITKNEYEKEKATINNEPWVSFVDTDFDPDKGVNGFYFEMDWNQQFIDMLVLAGYVGHDDQQIVEDWFDELCKSQTKEHWTPPNPGIYPMGFDNNA